MVFGDRSSGNSGFRVGCGVYISVNSQLLSRDDGSMVLVLPQEVGNTPEYGVISMNSLPLTTRQRTKSL